MLSSSESSVHIVENFIRAVGDTRKLLEGSIDAINATEAAFDFQKISRSSVSPLAISLMFREKADTFLRDISGVPVPEDSKIDYLQACDAIRDVALDLDVAGYDWNRLFPVGQSLNDVLEVASRSDEVAEVFESISNAFVASQEDLGMIITPNLMFLRSDFKMTGPSLT